MNQTHSSMPFDEAAEQGVLCSMLTSDDVRLQCLQNVKAEMFYIPANRIIYETLATLSAAGKPIDFPLVKGALKRAGQLDEIGGTEYLNTLWDFIPTSANWQYYAENMTEAYRRRVTIQACRDLETKMLYPGNGAASEQVTQIVEQTLIDLALRAAKAGKPFRELVSDVIAQITDEPGKISQNGYIKFGLPKLDKAIGAIEPGDFVIVSGETSSGKTALGLNLCLHCACQNQGLAIFSLEMAEHRIVWRLLANDASFPMWGFRGGPFTPQQWKQLNQSATRMTQFPIFVERASTVGELVNRCRQIKLRNEDLRVIVVDYLQLLQPAATSRRRETSREREVAECSRQLKGLALELKVVVLALSQINDEGLLRESRAIGHDADIVLRIDEPEKRREDGENCNEEDSKKRFIVVRKNRDGERGQKIPVRFTGLYMRFESAG